jgi:predicted nucleic acid-binding protein
MFEYLDASVIVKWFKPNEEFSDEANLLLDRLRKVTITYLTSEYSILEVTRALVRGKYERQYIDDAKDNLMILANVGNLRLIPTSPMISLSREIMIDYNLYASDAIHIATAVIEQCHIMWSADRHHLKESLVNYASKNGIKILSLDEVHDFVD